MNTFRLLLQTIRFYRKEHLLLLLGLILSTAVLTSALIIGDSIQFSLQKIVDQRLGNTQQLIVTQERFYPADFADILAAKTGATTAPLAQLRGTASFSTSGKRIPNATILGIDERFWKFGNSQSFELNENEVIINTKTALQLDVNTGDDILIRIEKARFVTDNAPFVPDEENSIALRLKVKAIIDADQFGNFNLQSNQITPYNLFVQLNSLTNQLLGNHYANLMLIGDNNLKSKDINRTIRENWNLEVMNLELDFLADQREWELRSPSIFLDDTLLSVLRDLQPQPIMTYLINFMSANDRYTPYSFVSGKSNYPGMELNADEIIITDWLAEDLQLKSGDTLELEYFTIGPFRKLFTEKKNFIVHSIIPVEGFASDPFLMPAFEGLAGVESCSSWDAGIPMEFSKIRDKDEEWWDNHKGTPKAYITYQKAVELWGQEYGNSTAIRFSPDTDPELIKRTLKEHLEPGNTGINIVDIQNDARWSAANAVDFAGLFLALSFFLILAAFLLSGLLFSMMMEQRSSEQGIYRSLGISVSRIRTIYFSEGLVNAAIGSALGIIAGILVSKLVLGFLNNIWFDIVRTTNIEVHLVPATLVIGAISNLLIATVVIHILLRHQLKKGIGILQRNAISMTDQFSSRIRNIFRRIAWTSTVVATLLIVYSLANDLHQHSTLLFVSGFLLLVALLCHLAVWIHHAGLQPMKTNTYNLALRHLYFDWKRNLTIVTIVAIGIFIVIATGANRVDFSRDATSNSSGTGGFDWFITTQIGVNADLNSSDGRNKTAIDETIDGFLAVQMHKLESDDASCLNLNRIIRPSVLGVDPYPFKERNSFAFVKTKNRNHDNPWSLLEENLGGNRIAAIADQTVITWGLGKAVGDSLTYLNERGDTIQLILVAGLANSVFQGHLLISEQNFITHFPSISGSKVMLVNASPGEHQAIETMLEGALRNYGVEIQRTDHRLNMFNSVTNTYLDIFLAMGGIALLLGTLGIAILLVRSVHSRRRIFAMMQAVGIKLESIQQVIAIEFLTLLWVGMTIGVIAAAIASLSGLLSAGAEVPYLMLLIILFLFKVNGILWVYLASRLTIKRHFIKDLRNE